MTFLLEIIWRGPQFICNNSSMTDDFLGHTFRHLAGLIVALRFCGFIKVVYISHQHSFEKYMWNIPRCILTHLLGIIDG